MMKKFLSQAVFDLRLSSAMRLSSIANPHANALQNINVPKTTVSHLSNGMRIVTENWNTPTSTVGVVVNAGSRYETERTNGAAHFLEHMAFKGTKRRSQHDIELEVENRGARLNAYTSRETTAYYAKCFSNDAPWAVDLISDILLHGLLQPDLINRERGVILREMQEISITYQEVVFDELHAGAYRNHPLSWTILGPEENVNNLQRTDLLEFLRTHYRGPEMALVGVGGIDHALLHQAAEKHFGQLSSEHCPTTRININNNKPQTSLFHAGEAGKIIENQIPQAHFALALEGPGWWHADTLTLMVASHICGHWQRSTGPPAMQISHFLPQRCYHGGLVNSYQSFFTCYRETSLWGIYVIAEGGAGLGQVISDIQYEWKRLASEDVSDEEIDRAKNQFCTSLLLQMDGTTATFEEIGRQLFAYDRRVPVAELLARVMSITPKHLRETCRKYIVGKEPAIASIGRVEEIPPYSVIRQGMSI